MAHKKVMNPPGTKKSRNILGQKNHSTFQHKKKSRNLLAHKKITQLLGTKKNHAISWQKKKVMQTFSTQKNSATSWQKKVMQPLPTKKSEKSRKLGQSGQS